MDRLRLFQCPEEDCDAVAEESWRKWVSSTDGPIQVSRTVCIAGHFVQVESSQLQRSHTETSESS